MSVQTVHSIGVRENCPQSVTNHSITRDLKNKKETFKGKGRIAEKWGLGFLCYLHDRAKSGAYSVSRFQLSLGLNCIGPTFHAVT